MADNRAWFRVAAFCLLLTEVAAVAAAQDVAGSFEQLRLRVRPGDAVTVTDTTGREMTGTIADVSSSSLGLIVGGRRTDVRERDVRTITRRQPDSRWNGTGWGLVIGAGGGALAAIPTVRGVANEYGHENSGGIWQVGVILGAGIGSGIGFVVDGLMVRRQTIYTQSSTSVMKVTFAPLLTSRHKGILMSLGF